LNTVDAANSRHYERRVLAANSAIIKRCWAFTDNRFFACY